MSRIAIVLASVVLATATGLAAADRGHAKPRISVMRWKDTPVVAAEPGSEKEGTCEEEILVIRAHDPDSSITKVQVWFDVNGDRAPFVFAHTFCVQGRTPGQPARLEVGAVFSEPGTYTVAAVAYSLRRSAR